MPFASNKYQRFVSRVLKRYNIQTAFDPQPYICHIKAPELISRIGKETFQSFFTFAFVRNPWDWQVSLYKYMLKDSTHYQHELIKSLGNFDQYIRWRCEEAVRFQKDFIYSEDGELLVDFVGRFERLDSDFGAICSRLGIYTSLPRLNVSNTRPYQEFYTKETKALVGEIFDADISLFNYSF